MVKVADVDNKQLNYSFFLRFLTIAINIAREK
jgi:hypothetical protein